MRFWETFKRAAWHQPLLVGLQMLLVLLVIAILSGLVGDAFGAKKIPGFSYGFACGYGLYRFNVFSRWRRMRRFRKYAEEQANKPTPRRGPYADGGAI